MTFEQGFWDELEKIAAKGLLKDIIKVRRAARRVSQHGIPKGKAGFTPEEAGAGFRLREGRHGVKGKMKPSVDEAITRAAAQGKAKRKPGVEDPWQGTWV